MPALMAEKEPYVAAVVGTLDCYMGRYAAQVKLQGPKVAIVLVRHYCLTLDRTITFLLKAAESRCSDNTA